MILFLPFIAEIFSFSYFESIFLAVDVKRIYNLSISFVPSIMFGESVSIRQSLFQFFPPWRIQNIVQCLAQRHFIAIGISDFAIEIQICTPNGQIYANSCRQNEKSSFHRNFLWWIATPFFRKMIKCECTNNHHPCHPICVVINNITNWICEVSGNHTMP